MYATDDYGQSDASILTLERDISAVECFVRMKQSLLVSRLAAVVGVADVADDMKRNNSADQCGNFSNYT